MQFHVVTLFPELFESVLAATMLKKGQERGALEFRLYNIRDHAHDKHRITDDTPYGGGQGMVMKVEPIVDALEAIAAGAPRAHRVLLSPRGRTLHHAAVADLARHDELVLVCGRYEGVDERVHDFVDETLSIGDYVLSGGELAAMVIADAVIRKLPGSLGDAESAVEESFSEALEGAPEYPHYTRPSTYRGWGVPDVLLSGDHERVREWRLERSRERAGG
jgi:tRNA (guanine37-N1)-methyltransferase